KPPCGVLVYEPITGRAEAIELREILVHLVERAERTVRIGRRDEGRIDAPEQHREHELLARWRDQATPLAATEHDGRGVEGIDQHPLVPKRRVAEIERVDALAIAAGMVDEVAHVHGKA